MRPDCYIVDKDRRCPSEGDYFIQNAKYGTFMDLSATDHKTVSGWSFKNVPNQKWTLQTFDGRTDHSAHVLRVKDSNVNFPILRVNDSSAGQIISVGPESDWTYWHIIPIDLFNASSVCQIFVPNTSPGQVVELKDGESANGGTIQLNSNTYSLHQMWVFHKMS